MKHSIYLNYINGKFQENNTKTFQSINPSTEELLDGIYPASNGKEVQEAVDAAKNAQKSWRETSRVKRADYFDALAQLIKRDTEKLTTAISLETGKSLNESRAEVIESLHMIQFTFGKGREPCGDIIASELAERDMYTIRKPKGVVAVITAFNFPLAVPFWALAPSLLEGNTTIFKPSEDAPLVGNAIANLLHEAGFPAGVFNMIHGDVMAGNALVKSDVDHICFTGSPNVGRMVRNACAMSRHKTCSCEMGSKSAVLVFEDADIDLALDASIASAFKLTGQRCVSSGRILVYRSIYDKFCQRFAEFASKITLGDPFETPIPYCGPLINEQQLKRVEYYNDLVRQDQCDILLDAKRMDRKGYFLMPMVYKSEWWQNKAYLREEVFGPHCALVPFDSVEDGVFMHNDVEFGLAVGVITNDYRTMRYCRDNLEAGMIYMNLGSVGAESHNHFGGQKSSGYGGASAAGTFDNVVHKVAVSINHGKELKMPQGLTK